MCLGRGIIAQKSLIQSISRHPIDMTIRMNNFLNIRSVLAFLDASSHLYNRLCPLVGRSVGNAFIVNIKKTSIFLNSLMVLTQ